MGLFLARTTLLEGAKVGMRNRKTLDGSAPRPDSDLNFVFAVAARACASVAHKLDLRLSVIPPGFKPIEPKFEPQSVRFDRGIAAAAFPVRIDKTGDWSFQLVSTFGGAERIVGERQHLMFTSDDDPPRCWRGLRIRARSDACLSGCTVVHAGGFQRNGTAKYDRDIHDLDAGARSTSLALGLHRSHPR